MTSLKIKKHTQPHINKARAVAKGFEGWERAEKIRDYFLNKTCHPHPNQTFNELAMNRSSDYQFAIDLLNECAQLTAENEIMTEAQL